MEYKYAPYSANKLTIFKDCPRKFYFNYILKPNIPRRPQIFFEKGNYIHKILEYFPKAFTKNFNFHLSKPKDVIEYRQIVKTVLEKDNGKLKKILDLDSVREISFHLSPKFRPQKTKTGALFTGKIDWFGLSKDDVPALIDWKSGKFYPEKSEMQLKLYALWAFSLNTDDIKKFSFLKSIVKSVVCIFWYVEALRLSTYKYTKEEYDDMKLYFLKKINKIEDETEFPKKPSNLCEYCDYINICNSHKLKEI